MNGNKIKIDVENSEKCQLRRIVNKSKNSILISGKKMDCELKRKKLEETTSTLITNIIRILKNEKIREISFISYRQLVS